MPDSQADYFDQPGLSASGMKDLEVSPLRYWHLHINPNRPKDEPTPEMQFGSAVHCAILEPDQFDKRYACECVPPEGCLDTVDDLRKALSAIGIAAKGTAKGPIIEQVRAVLPEAPILALLQQRHAEEHADKVIFKADDWARIGGAVHALREEPEVQRLMSGGKAEVPMFAKDPETGVLLKAKMDWVRADCEVDFKTFRQQRGNSIDKSIANAIFYEKYYRQAYMYSMIHRLASGGSGESAFVMPFVESEEPFETRIRILTPKIGGNVNVYWERARVEVRSLIRVYADYQEHFGDRPWRYAQAVTPLADEELPAGINY